MKIFLTGANGMLGKDLAPVLKEKKHRVTKVDVQDFDICDEKAADDAIQKAKPNIVIHCAAYTDVDGCEKDAEKALRVNGIGTKNIAVACEKLNIPILYISTDYVFDGTKGTPYRESDPVDPLSVYGLSKLMGERYVQKFSLKYYIVRTSWLYGQHGKNFVDTIINKGKTEKEMKVVIDQIGSPTWTGDLSKGIADLITTNEFGIYHFTNNGQCSWFDFAKSILKLSGNTQTTVNPMTTRELNRPARRPAFSKLNTDAIENTIRYKIPHWETALQSYLQSKYPQAP